MDGPLVSPALDCSSRDIHPGKETCEDVWHWKNSGEGASSIRDVKRGRFWMITGEMRAHVERVTVEAKEWRRINLAIYSYNASGAWAPITRG